MPQLLLPRVREDLRSKDLTETENHPGDQLGGYFPYMLTADADRIKKALKKELETMYFSLLVHS